MNSVPYTRLPSRLCEDEPQPTFHPQWGSSNSNDECLLTVRAVSAHYQSSEGQYCGTGCSLLCAVYAYATNHPRANYGTGCYCVRAVYAWLTISQSITKCHFVFAVRKTVPYCLCTAFMSRVLVELIECSLYTVEYSAM